MMKKFICCFLIISMLASFTTVFANSGGMPLMEMVLAKVKQVVDIPENFTKFTPYKDEYNDGNINFSFTWQPEEAGAGIDVSCDAQGRISRYYFYDNSLKSNKKISSLSKSEIIAFAEEFLKKTVPYAFGTDNDVLVFAEDSWRVEKLYYYLRFKRIRDGIAVKDNEAAINIRVVDDVPYVTSMNLYADYDGEFEPVPAELEGYEEKYHQAFPTEMIYKDDVRDYWAKIDTDETVETVLLYRYKDNNSGYILSSTGEEVKKDDDVISGGGGAFKTESASLANGLRDELFTEKELAELDKVREVIPKDDVTKLLKKLPYIGFDDSMQMSEYEIYRQGEKYMVCVNFADEKKERNIDATFDGKTGELLDFYNRTPYVNEDMTDAEKRVAEARINDFLKAATTGRMKEYSFFESTASQKRVTVTYKRAVNDVKYISDSIMVGYDVASGWIMNYYIDYAENRNFKSPDEAISADDAYKKLFDAAPLMRVYVKTDGVYRVCYTVESQGVEIDALTGDMYLPYGQSEAGANFEYNDIKGHWAEIQITKLAESQLGFKGEKFNPDDAITQYDLLRFMGAGVKYNSYMDYTEEQLYEILTDSEIITEDEKNPQGEVKREDAFVYFVRFMGYEEVAKLNDIYKVQYSDSERLTPEKIGYAAILSGMDVICGNDGNLRPDESITRAEAATILYNYLAR